MGQSKYKKAKKFWDGTYIGLSFGEANFLNPTFESNSESGQVQNKLGLEFNLNYRLHPLSLNVSYLGYGFDVPSITDVDEEKTPISTNVLSSGIHLSLLPGTRYFSPFAGGGYLVGNLKLEASNSISNTESSLALDNPYFIFGFSAKYNVLNIEGYYKRTMGIRDNVDREFYAVGLSFLLHLSAIQVNVN